MAHVTLTVAREHTTQAVGAIKEVGVDSFEQTTGNQTVIEFDTDDPEAVLAHNLFTLIGASVEVTPS